MYSFKEERLFGDGSRHDRVAERPGAGGLYLRGLGCFDNMTLKVDFVEPQSHVELVRDESTGYFRVEPYWLLTFTLADVSIMLLISSRIFAFCECYGAL